MTVPSMGARMVVLPRLVASALTSAWAADTSASVACTCSSSDFARAVRSSAVAWAMAPVSARRFSRSRCRTISESCALAVAALARAAATRAWALATATR